jgi:predicted ester cyclase
LYTIPRTGEDTVGTNEGIIRELFERGFTGGNRSVVEALFAPDAAYHQPGVPAGLEGLGLIVELNNDAFSDWRFDLEEVIESGDRVAVRWTARGRHENTFISEGPTGREVEMSGISVYGLRDGRVVEAWSSPNSLGLLQQIGVIPQMMLVD